jgi:hypothetical protein
MRLKQDTTPSMPSGRDLSHSPALSASQPHSPQTSKQPRLSSQALTDSETEEAAQALEDIALGRRQYLALGLNAEVPAAKAPSLESVSFASLPLSYVLY